MALWGNSDAVGSADGTIQLNYSTGVVTGTATTSGATGSVQVGDIIRIGVRAVGAAATYYGDAEVVSIASTISLTIGSTAGLSGVAVAATTYQVSQYPQSAILDETYSETRETDSAYTTYATRTCSTEAGIATDIIPINDLPETVAANDFLITPVNGRIKISSVTQLADGTGATSVSLASTIGTAVAVAGYCTFQRFNDGYDAYIYGVSAAEKTLVSGTQYDTGVGWVGVTTYHDNHGNLRVKKEVLVAMSGITTGNTPLYDAAPLT